jgi:hypothetical protein
MMKKIILAVALLALAVPRVASAQSSPNLVYGQVPTPGQWNQFFKNKNDTLGYTPLNKAGDTMLGLLVTSAPQLGRAGFNLPPSTAPASPVNGDFWSTSAGFYGQASGTTVGPFAAANSATFAATLPMAVTFPSNVVTYALNYNSSLTNSGGLGINLAHGNTFIAAQGINLNAAALPAALTGTVLNLGQVDATVTRLQLNAFGAVSTFSGAAYGGTNASPTAVTSGTEVASFNSWAYNGAALVGPIASFRTYAAENIASGHQGSYACIGTTPIASTTIANALCQQNDGGITVASPTGASEGSGTVNVAGGYYVNGALVSPAAAGLTGQIFTGVTSSAPAWSYAPVLGVNATTAGSIGIANGLSTGKTITIQNLSATAANYNFNLPATAGSAGQVFQSGGGTSAANTWSTATYPAIATGTGTILRADGTNWSATTATYPNTTTVNQILYSSSASVIGGISTVNGGMMNASTSGVPTMTITPVLGVPTASQGTLGFAGITSGTATITAQATAGTPTLTLPNASGTFAVSVSAPLALSATTGNLTITGAAGQVLAGATPAFTSTPTLGASGTLGTMAFGNATSGTITLSPVAGALGSAVLTMPAITDTLAGKALANGGTNASLTASNGGIVYSTASAFAILSGTATANQVLMSGTSTTPAWSTNTYPATAVAGTVLAAGTANTITASATPTLGASGVIGTLAFGNATSGTVTIGTVAGALGTVTASLPANTGILAELNYAQTWSAVQSHNSGDLVLNGSSSGATTLNANSASGTVTATLPANTGIIAELNYAQGWTATQTLQTILAGTTNTYDIGTSATIAAFRTVYAGTSFVGPVGTFTTSITTPTANLSGTSNQLVLQSAGVTGTLSWTPTSTNKTITLPDATGTVITTAGGQSIAGLTVTSSFTATGLVTLGDIATQATNTVLVNATAGSASPTAQAVSSCSAAGDALNWTTNTGFGCNTSITANAVPAANLTGATLASGVTASSLTSVGTLAGLTVTTSFTATGLVTNADLANPATTVNGQTCTLGSTCTISASAGTITPGTTSVASGTTNGLLYDNAGTLGNLATANSGVLVTSSGGVPSISTTLPTGLSAPNFTVTGAGSATAPTLTVGNSTTGLYSVSTTGIGVSVNGALKFDYGITTGATLTVNALAVTGNVKFSGASGGTIAYALCTDSGGNIVPNSSANCYAGGSASAAGLSTQVQYNSGGSLAANAGFTFDGVSVLSLGVVGTSVGGVKFFDATSGYLELVPTTGALGSAVLTLPDATDQLVGRATTDTLTNKSIAGSEINSGVVGVVYGGTGLATLTANNVILGNGTSTPQFVAPGTTGNILTSNGTTWTSAAPPAAGPVLLATLTASSSASLSDTTHITATYNSYLFVFRALLASATNAKIEITISTDNGSSYLSSGYINPSYNVAVTSYMSLFDAFGFGGTSAATQALCTGPIGGQLLFSNPNSATAYGVQLSGELSSAGGGTVTAPMAATSNSTTSVINAVNFGLSTGTWTSGSIEIWGNP